MQFQNANSTVTCAPNEPGAANSMVASGRQTAGQYFMLGITPLADDQRYNLQAAALQTTPGTFVAPTDPSLRSAASLLSPDTTSGTWPIPYPAFQTPAGASAYPGTMVVYAAVPTTGLPAADATDLATLLQFAASTGQAPGSGVGQLPPGYLPLTAANGLGALADYTRAAAAEVAAQNGQVPPLTPSSTSATPPVPAVSTSGTSPTTTGSSPTTTSSPSTSSGAGNFPYFVLPSFTSLFSSSPFLSVGARTGADTRTAGHKPTHPAPDPIPIWLGRTLDVALWTGGLGSGGALVALILGLALLIVVLVPPLYLVGRRRGKW
jgi:hypothetical protein